MLFGSRSLVMPKMRVKVHFSRQKQNIPIFRDVGTVVSIPLHTAKYYILLEETVNKSDLFHVLELKINPKGTYN